MCKNRSFQVKSISLPIFLALASAPMSVSHAQEQGQLPVQFQCVVTSVNKKPDGSAKLKAKLKDWPVTRVIDIEVPSWARVDTQDSDLDASALKVGDSVWFGGKERFLFSLGGVSLLSYSDRKVSKVTDSIIELTFVDGSIFSGKVKSSLWSPEADRFDINGILSVPLLKRVPLVEGQPEVLETVGAIFVEGVKSNSVKEDNGGIVKRLRFVINKNANLKFTRTVFRNVSDLSVGSTLFITIHVNSGKPEEKDQITSGSVQIIP